jgi:type I restriction enzyme S subunit
MSELPNGWTRTALGQVISIRNGFAFKSADFCKDGVPVVRQSNLTGSFVDLSDCVYVPATVAKEASNFAIERGDILIGMSGSIGEPSVYPYDFEAVQNQRTGLVRFYVADTGHRDFIKHGLTLFERAYVDKGKGVGIQNVSSRDIENIAIPLPPLSEQGRIATKIDSLSTKSKRARDQLDHIPRLVEKYKEAILARAFRGELTSDIRGADIACASFIAKHKAALASKMAARPWNGRKLADGGLPGVPKNWRWFLVGDIVIHRAGIAFESNDFCTKGKQVVRLGNLYQGILDLSRQPVFLKDTNKYNAFFATTGDLLVSQTGTKYKRDYGHFVAVPEQVGNLLINQRILCLTCIQGIDPKFLLFYSRTRLFREHFFSKETGGVNQGNVGVSGVMDAPIPLPPFSEQAEIVRRIKTAFTWIDRLASETTSARKLIDHLDQAVLAKAFQGELVPQDPNDEPASVLLERIRSERAAAPAKVKRGPKQIKERTARLR